MRFLLELLVAPPGCDRFDEPGEHVPDGNLTGLVAVETRQDAVFQNPGDPGETDLSLVDDHVADRGPDDHHERPRMLDPGAGNRHERVDVPDRHRD